MSVRTTKNGGAKEHSAAKEQQTEQQIKPLFSTLSFCLRDWRYRLAPSALNQMSFSKVLSAYSPHPFGNLRVLLLRQQIRSRTRTFLQASSKNSYFFDIILQYPTFCKGISTKISHFGQKQRISQKRKLPSQPPLCELYAFQSPQRSSARGLITYSLSSKQIRSSPPPSSAFGSSLSAFTGKRSVTKR